MSTDLPAYGVERPADKLRNTRTVLAAGIEQAHLAHQVELAGEKIDQTARQTMRIPTSASRGYFASNVPPGIHFGRNRKKAADEVDE
jgi:hypothetical protein